MFGYSLNYLIDMESTVIVDVEATPTRISKEVDAAETRLQRTEERFALKPERIAGDVAYGTAEMLGWLVGHDIDPHIPVWDRTEVAARGRFVRDDFTYDKERDVYTCPNGKLLKISGRVDKGTTLKYLAMTRLRLRGLTGARDEFLLTATVQNLKRLVERLAIPPPRAVAA